MIDLNINKINPQINTRMPNYERLNPEVAEAFQIPSEKSSRAGQRRLRTETTLNRNLDEIADILIKYHGSPDQALLWAAQNGDLEAVKKLLVFGADRTGTHRWGNITYSLLDLACLGKNIDLIKYLIETEKLTISNNAFLAALLNKDSSGFNMIEYFFSRGATLPEDILPKYLSNTQNSLVTAHDNDVVQFLTQLGAKYNPQKSPSNISIWISEWLFMNLYNNSDPDGKGNPESAKKIIKALFPLGLEHNLRTDLFMGEINGVSYSTPLLCAILIDDIEMVRNLITYNADVNKKGREKRSQNGHGIEVSPLQFAINLGRKEILVLLLEKGAKVS